MKKTLLLLIPAIGFAVVVSAQITLSQASYPATPAMETDSFKVTTAASAFPTLTAANNAMWDMIVVTDSTPVILNYRIAPAAAFTSATYADSANGSLGGLAYSANIQSAITVTAIIEYGQHIGYSGNDISTLGSPLTAPGDSFNIPQQDLIYSANRNKIVFPATLTSSWTSTYNSNFNFVLTLIALGYDHGAGLVKSVVTEKDSVVGWGKMRIKNVSGAASGYMDVLQVQVTTSSVDSYLVNGAPLNALVLGALNLTQGGTTTTYHQYYYRVMEVDPLASVTYGAASFATPQQATTHIQRLPAPSAVATINKEENVTIYPNPVSNRIISIDVPARDGRWSYELINITGQVVAADNLELGANQTHTQLSLSSSLTPGIYYVRFSNDGKQVCIRSLDIVK